MMNNIRQRIRSDSGAMGSVETILLIALAVFAVMAITKYIMKPMAKTSEGIGLEIGAMDPRN